MPRTAWAAGRVVEPANGSGPLRDANARKQVLERPVSHENSPSAEAVKLQPAHAHPRQMRPERPDNLLFTMSEAGQQAPERKPPDIQPLRHSSTFRSCRSCRIKLPWSRRPPFAAFRSPNTQRATRWWSQTGSNRRPPACKAGALPTELWPRRQAADRRQGQGRPSQRSPPFACLRDHRRRFGGPGIDSNDDLTLIRGAL